MPPASTKLSPQDTKSRILDAAEELFISGGFDSLSMRQITSAAGVNLAAVNYHFGSKDALIQSVLARKLDPLLPAMKAHGVPWLIRHLNGEISLEEAVGHAKLDTRHYAKRQFTWFRRQPPADWLRIEEGNFEFLNLCEIILRRWQLT